MSRSPISVLLVGCAALWFMPPSADAGHYVLAYWREQGRYENSGNHSIHVRVWNEAGNPVSGVQLKTSWGVLQATTDADGRAEIPQDTAADRDVTCADGSGSTSDVSPLFSTARHPEWGHYSHSLGFLYKANAGNPGTFDTSSECGAPNARGTTESDAPHTRSLIYNAIRCANRDSDAFSLDTWSDSFTQTFVVPAGVTRLAGVEFQGTIGGNDTLFWGVSVRQGGPDGTQIFSKNLPHIVFPFRWFLPFGVNDCPVTPGQTYAVRFTRAGGMNTYTVANVNDSGQFYRGSTAVSGLDLVGFVIGMSYGGAAATATPTNTSAVASTATPTATPAPTGQPGELRNGSLDQNTTSMVANFWESYNVIQTPQFLEEAGFWRHTPSGKSQRWWTDGFPHDAGIRQVVSAVPGTTYRFCAWLHSYRAGGAADGPSYLLVGIDPTGGTNLDNVVWSPETQSGDDWTQLCVEAQATANQITVYGRASATGPVTGERDSFMDDATLETIGVATPTPTTGPDWDGDAIPDALEGWPPAAGQSNMLLADSDGDGLADGVEDSNRNGQRDAGETDTRDRDSDDDGYLDSLDTAPLNPALPGGFVDTDGDELAPPADLADNVPDFDGDGFKDGYEMAVLGMAGMLDGGMVPPLGDTSNDGAVSNLDALVTQALFLGIVGPADPVFRGDGFSNGDPSRDGFISNIDALITQSFFLGSLGLLPL